MRWRGAFAAPDPGARVAAGNALLGVTERHRETACALGDRD